MTSTATMDLARWVAGTDPIAPAALQRARTCLLDHLRAVAIGAESASSQAVRRYVADSAGPGACTVLGTTTRTDPASAALANGSMAHACDIDDTHVASMLHPGASIIPAAFAIAEHTGAGGRALLESVVIGYEVAVRLSMSMQPAHFRQGFQATGTCGVFGATAAASRLLGADAGQIAGAFGVAGSLAGGLAQFYYSGSQVKRVHAGIAARNGVTASLLAAEGVGGPIDAIEGKAGFARAYAGGFDESVLLAGLGEDYAVSDVVFKPHATSARLQSAVEALLALLRVEFPRIDDITRIDVAIPDIIAGRLTLADPPDLTAAQMSLPFTLAVTVLASRDRGEVISALVPADYEKYLADPQARRLAAATVCRVDETISRITADEGHVPATVTLSTTSGDRSATVSTPPGSRRNPIPDSQHRLLFIDSVAGRLSSRAATAIVAAIDAVEEEGALPEIARLFVLTNQG